MSDIVENKYVMVSDNQKPALVPKVVSIMSKIEEHKLNRLNYLD